MTERRKHPRYKVRLLIKYKRLDEPLSKWQDDPHVENISLGGMLFEAYEKLPVSATLLFRMQIFTGESASKIIDLRAKVVGSEDGIASFPTRVAFIQLDDKAKAALKGFVNYLR